MKFTDRELELGLSEEIVMEKRNRDYSRFQKEKEAMWEQHLQGSQTSALYPWGDLRRGVGYPLRLPDIRTVGCRGVGGGQSPHALYSRRLRSRVSNVRGRY